MTNDISVQQCIDNCLNCYRMCLETLAYCLEKGGAYADPERIKLLMDCAEICRTSANFMLRGSKQHTTTCTACAVICRLCGVMCEELADDDEQLKACAAMCFTCTESCHAMAAH